jgi:hypothetical protein
MVEITIKDMMVAALNYKAIKAENDFSGTST